MTACVLVASLCGCASPPTSVPGSFPIAVRYGVEAALHSDESTEPSAIFAQDFRLAASMGFDTVALQQINPKDERAVVQAANDAGLNVMITPPTLRRFVQTGLADSNSPDARTLVRSFARSKTEHPVVIGVNLGSSGTDEQTMRAAKLASALQRAGVQTIVEPGPVPASSQLSVTVVDTFANKAHHQTDDATSWLAQFHRGIAAGHTAGLMVDRFRQIALGDEEPVSLTEPMPTLRRVAMRKLITRARQWGPRIARHNAELLNVSTSAPAPIIVTTLSAGQSRYIMVFNESSKRTARTRIELPAVIRNRPVKRLVEVPGSSDRNLGRVFIPRVGRVTLPVALAPGDAGLFEVF